MAGSIDLPVLDVYQRHGATWAKLRGDRLAEGPWLDRFSALLPAGAAVLDIGCGSGLPIAGELIRRGFDVAGVDGAPVFPSTDVFQDCSPGTASFIFHPATNAVCSPDSKRMPRLARR